MFLLGMSLICTLDGVQVGRMNGIPECFQQPKTQIMYEWEVILPPPVLLQLPSTHTHNDVTYLCCTVHIVTSSHSDCDHERILSDKDRLHLCAASLRLPDEITEL